MLKAFILAIAVFMLVFSAPVHAQEFKNEISFSVCAGTFPDYAEAAKDVGSIIILFGVIRQEASTATPGLIFKYGRFVSENVRMSLAFCYQRFNVEHFLVDVPWFTTSVSYYGFMLRGDYTYFRREWVQLYSGIGMGPAFVVSEGREEEETDTEYWFAFHLNAIGVRVGKQVAGFVELGFGYEGVISAGVTAAF